MPSKNTMDLYQRSSSVGPLVNTEHKRSSSQPFNFQIFPQAHRDDRNRNVTPPLTAYGNRRSNQGFQFNAFPTAPPLKVRKTEPLSAEASGSRFVARRPSAASQIPTISDSSPVIQCDRNDPSSSDLGTLQRAIHATERRLEEIEKRSNDTEKRLIASTSTNAVLQEAFKKIQAETIHLESNLNQLVAKQSDTSKHVELLTESIAAVKNQIEGLFQTTASSSEKRLPFDGSQFQECQAKPDSHLCLPERDATSELDESAKASLHKLANQIRQEYEKAIFEKENQISTLRSEVVGLKQDISTLKQNDINSQNHEIALEIACPNIAVGASNAGRGGNDILTPVRYKPSPESLAPIPTQASPATDAIAQATPLCSNLLPESVAMEQNVPQPTQTARPEIKKTRKRPAAKKK